MLSVLLRRTLRLEANPTVFVSSAALIGLFVGLAALLPSEVERVAGELQGAIIRSMGWLYSASMTAFLAFALWLALSRYGRIKLGPDDARPRYGRLAWSAMLFSAGMGIGVMFFSVAEPIAHYQNPPTATPHSAEAAREAMLVTMKHWGLHGWGVYVVVGLALAYFSHRRRLPLTLRSAFRPLLGRHVEGALGHVIDIFSVLGTMFGVAASLGLGAQQINAGLDYLLRTGVSVNAQIWLVVGITAAATASVVSGLDRGIRMLSLVTVVKALALLLFVLVVGQTGVGVRTLGVTGVSYLGELVGGALWAGTQGDPRWQGTWTLSYWAWWIAWSPFVGMFVARISYGRTIREFVLGALIVPTLVTIIWFSVFGGMALARVQGGDHALGSAVQANIAVAMYAFFSNFPAAAVLSAIAVLLTVLFFVTSSDSASLVIDIITAGGHLNPPKHQRVFWASAEGAAAIALLTAGGLTAMRTFQLTTGAPLCLIIIAMCCSLVKGLRQDPLFQK